MCVLPGICAGQLVFSIPFQLVGQVLAFQCCILAVALARFRYLLGVVVLVVCYCYDFYKSQILYSRANYIYSAIVLVAMGYVLRYIEKKMM